MAIFIRARLLAASLLILPVASVPVLAPAVAQSRATSTLAVISQIAEAPDQSAFALTVGPRVGSYAVDNSDPARPGLVLKGAARSPNLASEPTFRGLVRSIKYETTDSGLVVRFVSAAPAKLEVKESAPDRLLVTVTKLSGAEAIGSRPVDSANDIVVPATGLPPAVLPPAGQDGFELVMLKYADVSEVVGLLTDGVTVAPNNVFIRREPGFGSVGNSQTTTYSTTQGQAALEEKPLGQAVGAGLAIDRRLNAIWIKGAPDYIEWVKAQIAKIDIPVDSVILETQFVELTETGARNIGIDFANAAGQIGVATVTTGSFNPFDVDPKDILPSAQVQAAVYAQVAKGEGRILSKPRIAAQSGSTAKIITGDALPILTAITLSGVNAVQQQVQYVNVGVTLQIAPRVSPDGYVTSHIYGVVSSVTGYSQGYPTISQREAETSASVRDGETFVIGGLTMENNIKTKSKVPLFGDIPLLGEAFKLEKSTRSTTELYIVITPHIVRHRRFQELDNEDQQTVPGASAN